ncbi:MAG TPA: methionyl-tRNA formyltransferase [Chloroflexia bacterium]|nr:methionyl-tRNA formyltransferase [Chloroflexia bacterium]
MDKSLKILFMGTPQFGATVLKHLASAFEVVGVVTQPDRPAGRKNTLTPPAVKVMAQELGLPVMQVEKLRTPEVQEELRRFANGADVFVVASFGMILPQVVLDMPPLKCINVHASLLPAYRGASPVAQAILDGLAETGVTIMQMEKGLDTGPMLAKVTVAITPDDTQPTLMDKLAEAGAALLVATLPKWASAEIIPEPQDSSQASHTGIIKKEDGLVNWQESAASIERKIRAYDPWPGVYTYWTAQAPGQPLKLGRADVFHDEQLELNEAEPLSGTVLISKVKGNGERLIIKTGDSYLAPRSLQMPGKKMLPVEDFIRGYRNINGAHLGQ